MTTKSTTGTILQQVLAEGAEIRKDISDIKVILERNTVSLEEHMRRTEIAEERLEKVENHVLSCPARLQADTNSEIWKRIKNYSLLTGLVVLIVKEFWPAIKSLFSH
jgi:hypothetical protein